MQNINNYQFSAPLFNNKILIHLLANNKGLQDTMIIFDEIWISKYYIEKNKSLELKLRTIITKEVIFYGKRMKYINFTWSYLDFKEKLDLEMESYINSTQLQY